MNISKHYDWKTTSGRKNSPLPPQSLRGLVIKKSGCGKTTMIFNLLLQPGWLDYVFGKSLHQQEYKVLRKGLKMKFQTCSIVKASYNTHQKPLISTVELGVELFKLTFTMAVKTYQIHQHLTQDKRICYCWTTAYWVNRTKPRHTTHEADTTTAIHCTLLKCTFVYPDTLFERIPTS